MPTMSAKENALAAIRHAGPEWVPCTNEPIWQGIAYEGNFRVASWTDAWGTRWETTRSDMVPFPKGNPLPSLDLLDPYDMPDPDRLFVISEDTERYFCGLDRSTCFVFGSQTYFLFERAWALMGMEPFMEALLCDVDRLQELLRRITDYNIRVFERYMAMGCDGVTFSEDLGTQRALLISPNLWRELFLPEYARAFAPVRAAGGMINFHSCGRIDEIVADLVALGVDILNPVQARANDLQLVKAQAQGRMALMGGIDTQHELMRGTPDDVEAEVARVMGILAPGGGYICGPDQGMPFPEGNIAALWRAAHRHGRYGAGGWPLN